MLTTNQKKLQTKSDKSLFKALYSDKRKEEKIDNLLKQGTNVNATNEKGGSPLHTAIHSNQNVIVIKMLLKYGAKVNALNNQDRTPLHIAALKNKVTVTKELLINGADVNAQDCNGMTPLALYIKNNIKKRLIYSRRIIYLFLIFGANLNDIIDNNFTLKKYVEELEAIKEIKDNFPHCAKLIEASKNSDWQYNENIQELDREFEAVKEFYCNFVFNTLQDLRQYVLQKSNSVKAISTFDGSTTVGTNAEVNLKRKAIPNDQTNNNLPLKKRKLQENVESCSMLSGKLIVPNIPNKQVNILEVIHYLGYDMFL